MSHKTASVWVLKHILSFTYLAFITQTINKTKTADPEGHCEKKKKNATGSATNCTLKPKSNIGLRRRLGEAN